MAGAIEAVAVGFFRARDGFGIDGKHFAVTCAWWRPLGVGIWTDRWMWCLCFWWRWPFVTWALTKN